mgnify:CR=1 FL=1
MTIWIDAQLSPNLAKWLRDEFGLDAFAVRDLGLRDADDLEIFRAAGRLDAIVLTKDKDFVDLLDRYGPPPKVIWLTCGNTSNKELRRILGRDLPQILDILSIEILIEVF